jgi:hypothetical protein
MDLLGFFKEKKYFLELKFVNPFKMARPHRIPLDPDPMRSVLPRPARGWPAIGGRRRSRGKPCGLARCGPTCGRAEDGLAAADPGGSTVAPSVR